MRISTRTFYETGTNQLGSLQTQLAKTQMQLSTQRRILTPSDDPIASARVLEIHQSQSLNEQLGVNRGHARDALNMAESALGSVTSLIQDVQTIAIQAGNAAHAQSDREALATEIEGRLQDLMALANSNDGMGNYLFSGYRTTTPPFTRTAAGISYGGDHGQRQLQVGSARQLAVSESGAALFIDIPTGNGKFNTAAAASNTGTGVISMGAVSDPAAFKSDAYRIDFDTSVPGSPTYTITNTTSSTVVASAQPYTSGNPITVAGMTVEIKGVPAHGDQFTLKPAARQSVFKTIENLITNLRTPQTSTNREQLTAGLDTIGKNLWHALDNVLSARSTIGAGLKELDYLDSAGDDLNIQYAARRSELEDLDLVKAVSDFSQQQVALEAAQKSFKSMSGLSLFNYIG